LLGEAFGDPAYAIYVIKVLDVEFSKAPHLQSKFYWVKDNQFVGNRGDNCLGSEIDPFELTQTIKFMKDHKYQRGLGVSMVDIVVLATGYLLGITIISDDKDIQEMAKDYEMIECMTSLEVLEWLYGEGILTLKRIKAIVQMWRHDKDLPNGEFAFEQIFFEMFNSQPW
jgi:hypothetical protein